MKIITVFNNKGGVGKTTTTACIGYELSQSHNKKVLLIDNDGQGNLSKMAIEGNKSLSGVILSGYTAKEAVRKTAYKNLDIITSDKSLEDGAYDGMTNEPKHWLFLKNAIEELKNEYDYALIDNCPGRGCQVFNSLCASDEIIAPIFIDDYSLAGLEEINNMIIRARQVTPDLLFLGVLINCYEKDETIDEVERQLLEQTYYPVFKKHIRRSKKMLGGRFSGKAIQEYSEYSGISQDFKAVVNDYLNGEI